MWTHEVLIRITTLAGTADTAADGGSGYGLALLWLGVIVAAIAIESITSEMVSIWFAPAALVSMILSFFTDFTVQLIVFIVLSAALIITTKIIASKKEKKDGSSAKSGIEQLIGRQAVVVEAIDNRLESGAVKINGQLWTARMESDDDKPAVGEHVEIAVISGSKLICRPVQ